LHDVLCSSRKIGKNKNKKFFIMGSALAKNRPDVIVNYLKLIERCRVIRIRQLNGHIGFNRVALDVGKSSAGIPEIIE
jgi:hypothetical protein